MPRPDRRPSKRLVPPTRSAPARLIGPDADEIARLRQQTARRPVAPTKRTTTPRSANRGQFRPVWHRVVGGLLIVLGIGIFVINDLALFDIDLMPGGHNEIWAPIAIFTAVSSMWWFGWLDRST